MKNLMFIYSIKSSSYEFGDYDVFRGMIVVAHSPKEAREISERYAPNKNEWQAGDTSLQGLYLGLNKHPFVLMGNFING